jgi:predicted RNA-binding Zn-ribbon protein involved in translation (DUF1610 family)
MNHRFGAAAHQSISALPCPCCGGRMVFKRTTQPSSDAITHGCGYCGAEITRTKGSTGVEEEFERMNRLR